MKETEFTERELTIMTESFVVGRMYGLMRKQESDDEILKLLKEECIKGIKYSQLSEDEKIWQ